MLKVLPDQISNLIAAGEVIQRPASVVKELVENAVDAGASSVQVIINDSGRTLIQVIDNGCGMTKEEAVLCFERHATSKISKAEDLYHISTYGFRGEALASIAACGEITMKSRKEGEETGTEVCIAESKIVSCCETGAAQGTNIAVRNIFYNIPARRKFLKSDNYEFRQILSELIKIALTKTGIEFKLIHNSKTLMHLPVTENIKQRIIQIDGINSAKDLINLNVSTHVAGISGYVGNPQLSKKNQQNQYMFVNGRYFKSFLLHRAIMKAYDKLIPEGSAPSYYLYLQVEPSEMDVNIHPTKTEIKFENESVMFEILLAAVREAIGIGAFMPGLDFDTEGSPEIPAVKSDFYSNREKYMKPPKIDYNPLFNPFESENQDNSNEFGDAGSDFETKNPYGQHKEVDEAPGLNDNFAESGSILQIKGKYIVTTVKSGLLLIDVRRAKERILYERYLDSISHDNPEVQESLFPETIDVRAESYHLLMEHQEQLKQLGFDLRPFGENCIVVYGMPAIFANEQIAPSECIENILSDLKELENEGKDNSEGAEEMKKRMKEKIASDMVKSESLFKSEIDILEAQILIDSLFACKYPDISPQGKRCVTIITLNEIADKFKTR
jgi:DNA mismatch repair protein MutL